MKKKQTKKVTKVEPKAKAVPKPKIKIDEFFKNVKKDIKKAGTKEFDAVIFLAVNELEDGLHAAGAIGGNSHVLLSSIDELKKRTMEDAAKCFLNKLKEIK